MGRCLCLKALSLLVAFSLLVSLSPTTVAAHAADGGRRGPPAAQPTKGSAESASTDAVDEGVRLYKQAARLLVELYDVDSVDHIPRDESVFRSFVRGVGGRTGLLASAARWLTLIRIPGLTNGNRRTGKGDMSSKALKALDLLHYAVELGNVDALEKLADVSLFPPSSMHPNLTRAYEAYERHANLTGAPFSQAMLGFFHATGYGDVVPPDQAKALLYYTFAALGGDQTAEMALGYRHWAGIGVGEDCTTALMWYESAAERAFGHFLSGPPGGRTLPLYPTRLSDLVGGVYGPGSSVASTGYNANRAAIRAGLARAAGETWQDILEFYQYHTDQGELEYTLRLGRIYYHGTLYTPSNGASAGGDAVGAVTQDYTRARQYFLRIARQVWPRDTVNAPLKEKREVDDRSAIAVSQACGYLGRIYLRGEGVKADARVAKMWFERGAEYGDRESHNGLGVIYKDGLTGVKDDNKAISYFAGASGADLAESQVQLGRYHLVNGDIGSATQFFDIALRHGSPFEAYYYLAHVHANGARSILQGTSITTSGSCAVAMAYYKVVAERGSWKTDWMGKAERRWNSGDERDKEVAKVYWAIAAEAGHEVAQNNLAYLLDKEIKQSKAESTSDGRKALLYWTRCAAQNNIDALVKVGDYHYAGVGVPEEAQSTRLEKAASYYQSAVETQLSALAMWNLGWMYENGLGIPQDFHLAKRYYDLALETNPPGYLPVVLSLAKLYFRSIWHTLSGGRSQGLSLWDLRDSDDHWYLGKARDESSKSKRRKTLDGVVEPQEEDPVEWARGRRGRDGGDFGSEDYMYPSAGEGEDEGSREFAETLLLLVLCGIVAWLIYLRTQWMNRRAEEARRRAGEGAGGEQVPPPAPGLLNMFGLL